VLQFIATRCGLDNTGIESRRQRDFPHPSRPAQGLTQPYIKIYRVTGVKLKGRGVDCPPPSSAEVKETVDL